MKGAERASYRIGSGPLFYVLHMPDAACACMQSTCTAQGCADALLVRESNRHQLLKGCSQVQHTPPTLPFGMMAPSYVRCDLSLAVCVPGPKDFLTCILQALCTHPTCTSHVPHMPPCKSAPTPALAVCLSATRKHDSSCDRVLRPADHCLWRTPRQLPP